MRASITLTLWALVSFAVAQDLSQLPDCARDCVGTSLSTTGCNQLDIGCICRNQGWIAGLSCCIAQGCTPAEQQTTIDVADALCLTVGVTLPTSASCSASGGPTSTDRTTSSSAAASSGSTSASTTVSEAFASGSTASGSTASSTASSESSTASTTAETSGSSTGTPVTAAASAASTSPASGAANKCGAEMGLLGLAAALFAVV